MNTLRRTWIATLALLCLAGVASADAPVKLRYQMKEGDRTIYRTRTEIKQSQAIGKMKFETQVSTDQVATAGVDKVDEQGNGHLHQQTERFKFVSKIGPIGDYTFDSQAKEQDRASALGKLMTPVFERMSGSAVDLVVSPRGEVKEVQGFAELFADLLKDNPLAGQLVGGGSNEAAKSTFSEQFVQLNNEPVKPGDTWEVPFETELPKLGKLKGKKVYRYEGPDKVGDRSTAKLSLTTEVAADIDSDLGEAKISGSFSSDDVAGTIQFDPVAGKLVSMKVSLKLMGDLTLAVGGNTIPFRLEQSQTVSVDVLDKLPEDRKP